MKQLAIKFKDNDFHSTFTGVLGILKDVMYYRESEKASFEHNLRDKQWLADVINSLSPIAYQLYQSNDMNKRESDDYLMIDASNIYLDKEVAEFIEQHNGWYNSSFFCIDFTTEPQVYIYSI
tara:strand:+ start:9744 stop:10109 length:366 start_codon:yes stop_codon:yes gene_type:complete